MKRKASAVLALCLVWTACSGEPDDGGGSAGNGGTSDGSAAGSAGTSGGSGGGSTGGTGGTGGSGGADAAAGAAGSAADAAPDSPAGCKYEKVFEQAGEVLTVVDGASEWEVFPLAQGQGFACARFEFDMLTADTLAPIKAAGGCPIFTAIGGFGANGKQIAGGLFKVYQAKANCPLGPTRLEMDAFAGADVQPNPYVLGNEYHVVIEVVPVEASISLYDKGQLLSPVVKASVAGATIADTVNPRFHLGQAKAVVNAYYPNYGAVYSNVAIWADVVTP